MGNKMRKAQGKMLSFKDKKLQWKTWISILQIMQSFIGSFLFVTCGFNILQVYTFGNLPRCIRACSGTDKVQTINDALD